MLGTRRFLRLRPTGLALRVLHLKSEIRNLKLDQSPGQARVQCDISDLRCRIRPISKFPSRSRGGFLKYVIALTEGGRDIKKTSRSFLIGADGGGRSHRNVSECVF